MNGSEIMTGDTIIMPIDISTLATTRSMTTNGTNSRKPISKAVRNSLVRNAADDQVDDEKGDEDGKADLECGFQLAGDVGRDQHAHGNVLGPFHLWRARELGEQCQVGFASLAQHEGF